MRLGSRTRQSKKLIKIKLLLNKRQIKKFNKIKIRPNKIYSRTKQLKILKKKKQFKKLLILMKRLKRIPKKLLYRKRRKSKTRNRRKKKNKLQIKYSPVNKSKAKKSQRTKYLKKKRRIKSSLRMDIKQLNLRRSLIFLNLPKKPVNSEENFKEFRVYASIVDDEVPAQHYRSQRVPKRELKAQSVAAPETTQMATLAPDQNKTQVEEQVTQETSNNTSLQNGVNLEQPQQIHQEQQQIHTDNVGTAVQPNGLDTPDNTNANGNGIASGSLVQEAAVEVEEEEEEEEEEEPWVSRSGLPVVEADAVLQPTGFRPEGEGETAKQSHHNPHLKIKITEAKTHKVKLETTVPAGYVKQVSSWIPEVQSVDLKVLMDIADQLPVGNTQPVSEFKSGKGDLVQIWVEEDQK
eukprot:TRINITY_DN12414_c0_g3_i1.p1 TRINITY_DN12414_c0_g3~~TRINITY_DN12414_c0_g3_i1.p1  ORF type:complete len:406 (-),score=66.71 TRINITY_DN12414_c0_g3_i1:243-1460(-)